MLSKHKQPYKFVLAYNWQNSLQIGNCLIKEYKNKFTALIGNSTPCFGTRQFSLNTTGTF